jgi:hypothetical protein
MTGGLAARAIEALCSFELYKVQSTNAIAGAAIFATRPANVSFSCFSCEGADFSSAAHDACGNRAAIAGRHPCGAGAR